jgi:hypothetical protein
MSSDPFVEFAAGDIALREGDPADALYLVESGYVTIFRLADPERPLAMLGPGDLFGEAAILQERAHVASARAETAMRALRIATPELAGVLRENVEVAVQLMRRLVQRLLLAEQGGAAEPIPPPDAVAEPASGAPIALLLRHVGGDIAVPAGKPELIVGRPDPATGAIPEIDLGEVDTARTLSRRHARLSQVDGRWMLREEPGVGNGTWLNGERLQPGQTLPVKAGDQLQFGAIEVELVRD